MEVLYSACYGGFNFSQRFFSNFSGDILTCFRQSKVKTRLRSRS
uniref:Uncharacterized protein n=1 Tax=viral metagenome TaxID=1070528 RepID=A0A6C0IWT9_9ZZZZ